MTSDDIEAVFKRLVPAEVRIVAVAIVDAPADWPLPNELRTAKTSRQREFIAGRWCAARVLALLGVSGEVGRRDDRSPAWPGGVRGSISHTDEFAVAAAGRIAGIGIDLEPQLSASALSDLRQNTIDDSEWKLLGEDPALATALFSAKESVFKRLYPPWLEYTDAKLVGRDADTLALHLASGDISVKYALAHGHAFTAVTHGTVAAP